MAKSRTIRARKKKLESLRTFLYGFICCAESPVQDVVIDDVEPVQTRAVYGHEILSPEIDSQKSCMTLPQKPKQQTFDYDIQGVQEDKTPVIDERPLSEKILDDIIMKIILAKYEERFSQHSHISKSPHVPTNITNISDEESNMNVQENKGNKEDKVNNVESKSNAEFVRQILDVIIEATVRKNEIKPKKPLRPPASKRSGQGLQTDIGQENSVIVREIIDDMINEICQSQPKKISPPRPPLPKIEDSDIIQNTIVNKSVPEVFIKHIIDKLILDSTCCKDSKCPKRPPAPKKSLSVMEISDKYQPLPPKRPLSHESLPSSHFVKPRERHILSKCPLPPFEQVSTKVRPTKPPRPPAMQTASPKRPQLQIGISKQIRPQGKSKSLSPKSRASPTRPQRPTRPPKPIPKEPQTPNRPPRPGETTRPIQMFNKPEKPPRPQIPPLLKESQNLTRPRRPPRPKCPPVVQKQNAPLSPDDYPDELNPFADDRNDDQKSNGDESECDYQTADSDSYTDERFEDEYPDELNPFDDDVKLKDDEFNDKYPDELNPFGEDDEHKDVEVNEYNVTNATDDYPEELNPFADDDDDE